MTTKQQNSIPERRITQDKPVRAPLSRRRNPVSVHPAAEGLKRSIQNLQAEQEEAEAQSADSVHRGT